MVPTLNGNLYFAQPGARQAWTSDITQAQEFTEDEANNFIQQSLTGELQEAAVAVKQVLAYSSPPYK